LPGREDFVEPSGNHATREPPDQRGTGDGGRDPDEISEQPKHGQRPRAFEDANDGWRGPRARGIRVGHRRRRPIRRRRRHAWHAEEDTRPRAPSHSHGSSGAPENGTLRAMSDPTRIAPPPEELRIAWAPIEALESTLGTAAASRMTYRPPEVAARAAPEAEST